MAVTDTWDDVLGRVRIHLERAGRSLKRPVTDVRFGEPAGVNAPMIAYWYAGDSEGLVGNSLNLASYNEHLTIRWYWPVSDRTPILADTIEREVRKANRATTKEFWGDFDLDGSCAGIRWVSASETGWADMSGWVRTLTLTLGIEMPDLDDIAVET